MTQSNTSIRPAVPADAPRMVEIMKANNHYYTPAVDGIEAIQRQMALDHNVILVAQTGGQLSGFVLGTWDGARAFLFKISVHPDFQDRGIGTAMIREAARIYKAMGAVTVGLSAADGTGGEKNNSIQFWESLGFERIPARLMIHFDIDDLIEGRK